MHESTINVVAGFIPASWAGCGLPSRCEGIPSLARHDSAEAISGDCRAEFTLSEEEILRLRLRMTKEKGLAMTKSEGLAMTKEKGLPMTKNGKHFRRFLENLPVVVWPQQALPPPA